MKYILIAYKSEAKVIFKHYTCKKDENGFYLHDKFCLVILGGGYKYASKAIQNLFAHRTIHPEDVFLNFGICGGPQYYEVGTLLKVNRLRYDTHEVILQGDSGDIILTCKNEAVDYRMDTLVDMESFAVYETLGEYAKNLEVYKVVSDHFKPESITKALISEIVIRDEIIEWIDG